MLILSGNGNWHLELATSAIVYFYIHYSNSLKVTALKSLQKIWVHPLNVPQGGKDFMWTCHIIR